MVTPPVKLHGRSIALIPFADARVRLVHYEPGQHMARHAHDWFGLTLVVAGSLEDTDALRTAVCRPLTLVCKPAGAEHATQVGLQGALTVHFELDSRAVRALAARGLSQGACAYFSAGPATAALLDTLRPGNRQQRTRLADVLTSAILDRAAASPPVDTAAASEFGRTVLCGSTRRSADFVGMHPVSFARAFRRQTGVAPSLWRLQQRLALAAGALAASQEPFARVADAAGFSDQAHLCRVFRRETGLTPGGYRTLVRSLQGRS